MNKATELTTKQEQVAKETERAFRKNYKVKCMVCGQKPTVGDLELCGPCTLIALAIIK